MNIKLIKILIISILCIYYYAFAVNDQQQLVVASLGSSVTAGVIGYSQAEIEIYPNDRWIDYYFIKRIKPYNIYHWLNYISSNHSIASILTTRTKEYTDNLKIINGFDAFNQTDNTYFHFIKKPNFLGPKLYKLINDPFFYLILQLTYAAKNNASVILGIDMFFWIIYSKATDELTTDCLDINNHKKIKTLKKLLELLNNNYNSKVNFIIGNIPQVSFISMGINYSVDPNIIDHANNILQKWVASRNSSDKAKAVLIDITKTYNTAKTDNNPFKLHENMLAYTRKEILSTDDLHLSLAGMDILITYIAKTLEDSSFEIFHKLGTMFDN